LPGTVKEKDQPIAPIRANSSHMSKAKLLLAMNLPYLSMVENALSDYALLTATTFRQAERLLIEDGIAMCVISVHFDDSRAVDLIRFIRDSKHHKHTPICVLRLLSTQNADFLRETMTSIQKLLEVGEYLELNDDPQCAEKIKNAIDRQLKKSSIAQIADIHQ
jgi:hypothetical protein